MTVLEFSRKHWAAASALFIATSVTIVTGAVIVLYPSSILAIEGFTLFDTMPLAFIGPMPLPAAIATVSVLVFSINLILSTLFSASFSGLLKQSRDYKLLITGWFLPALN